MMLPQNGDLPCTNCGHHLHWHYDPNGSGSPCQWEGCPCKGGVEPEAITVTGREGATYRTIDGGTTWERLR
jgi:photosystem II stability/assembly factor-like uncharacterized protein